MHHRSLTPLRLSLALTLALLALPSVAAAYVTAPVGEHRFTFDEESGDVAYDDIGYASGFLASSATRDVGPFGTNAITITPQSEDDPEGYVDFGNEVGAFGDADFTVAHWYRTSESGTLADILGNRTAYSHGNFIAVRLRGDGVVTVELDENWAGFHYVAVGGWGLPVNDGQWHHLAYVRAGGTVNLYIDGALAGSNTTADGQPTHIYGGSTFRIGQRLPGFSSIAASFDDLRIFDRALSDDEILDVTQGAL